MANKNTNKNDKLNENLVIGVSPSFSLLYLAKKGQPQKVHIKNIKLFCNIVEVNLLSEINI